jgi:GTPase
LAVAAEIEGRKFEIGEFLAQERGKDLLRFSTAGSVDDGKSTLIGRLLHDSKSVFEDQMAAVKKSADRHCLCWNPAQSEDRRIEQLSAI